MATTEVALCDEGNIAVIKLLAHIAHLEVSTPDVEKSVRFYETEMGLRVVDRADGKVFLRCWGDYDHHSLVISEGPETTLVRMAWRTSSADALEEAARRVEGAGVEGRWKDAAEHHGRSYEFTGPYGHVMELYWEVEPYVAPPEFASRIPDRPERRAPNGVGPRFLDHVTIAASDVRGFAEWHRDVLGFRIMAFTDADQAPVTIFGVLTTNEKSHDLGIVRDSSARGGRVNHIAFWVENADELSRAADILMEAGTAMEYGPGVHGIGEQDFLYFREPSSLRLEVNSGGYRNYVPDWEPRLWTPSLGSLDFYRNRSMPMSMTESFPLADGAPSATEEGIVPGTEDALLNPYH